MQQVIYIYIYIYLYIFFILTFRILKTTTKNNSELLPGLDLNFTVQKEEIGIALCISGSNGSKYRLYVELLLSMFVTQFTYIQRDNHQAGYEVLS